MRARETSGYELRALVFGLPFGVSAVVLQELLNDGPKIAGLVLPAATVPHLFPDHSPPYARVSPHLSYTVPLAGAVDAADTLAVAWSAGLPVWAVRDFEAPESLAILAGLQADVACVACFTRRIPPAVLRIPPLGILNLHPSLLPAYRGPSPLFWQLRDGAPTGCTVHYMNEGLDTGDITAQAELPLPDGITWSDAERLLMLGGLELLRGVVHDLSRGIVRRRPQPAGGSYQPSPTVDDFSLSTEWPARRAFNFMRGTADQGHPYRIEIAGNEVRLAAADSYAAELALDRPSVRHGRNILIRFNPGILYARTVV